MPAILSCIRKTRTRSHKPHTPHTHTNTPHMHTNTRTLTRTHHQHTHTPPTHAHTTHTQHTHTNTRTHLHTYVHTCVHKYTLYAYLLPFLYRQLTSVIFTFFEPWAKEPSEKSVLFCIHSLSQTLNFFFFFRFLVPSLTLGMHCEEERHEANVRHEVHE